MAKSSQSTSTFCIHLRKRDECPNSVCNPLLRSFDSVIQALTELSAVLPNATELTEDVQRFKEWRDSFYSDCREIEANLHG